MNLMPSMRSHCHCYVSNNAQLWHQFQQCRRSFNSQQCPRPSNSQTQSAAAVGMGDNVLATKDMNVSSLKIALASWEHLRMAIRHTISGIFTYSIPSLVMYSDLLLNLTHTPFPYHLMPGIFIQHQQQLSSYF